MDVDRRDVPEPLQASPRALTSKQERKLVNYVDEKFLDLTRNYKKRTETSSSLKTLPAYIEAVGTILAFILQIPPIDPSTGLRVAYLLRLTGDVLGAIPGYKLGTPNTPIHTTLQNLLDFLDDLDQAWIAVLQGQIWDPASAEAIDLILPVDPVRPPELNGEVINSASPKLVKSSPPSQTDIARLRSLLFSGESTLEEWLSSEREQIGDVAGGDETEAISSMLAGMGLLDQFDSLFVRTLDYLGGFAEHIARNVVLPEPETRME